MPYFFKNFNLAIRQGFLIIFFLSLLLILKGQERGAVEAERVFVKEWNATIKLHTNGFGVGFEHGRMPNYFDKHFWEVNFQYVIHPKSVRAKILTIRELQLMFTVNWLTFFCCVAATVINELCIINLIGAGYK